MQTLLQDIRYALRVLAKSPAFTVTAVLTLALGIGANAAMFSAVNGVLLNPLPYPQPDELVTLHESKPNFDRGSISFSNFLDWRKDNRTFASMALHRGNSLNLTGTGEAEQVPIEFVTTDFFPQLGVKPVAGRALAEGEDRVGEAPVVLVSAGFAGRKFQSVENALGKGLTLDGKHYTIVGVMPDGFDLTIGSFRPREIYVPVGQWSNNLLMNRSSGLGFHGIGRLKPGVTIQQAQADLNSVTRALAEMYPNEDKGIGAAVVPFKQEMVGKLRGLLLLLLGAVGFVLLIACVNVANILLARSTARSREFAIRMALGAGQPRLVRQMLTESLVLALAGGTAGLLVGKWGMRAALGMLPTALPRASEIRLDARVLVFSIAVTVLSGVLFGLVPALRFSRPMLQQTLAGGGRGGSGLRNRAQGIFVAAEMAMALVLLVGAGLMIRSLAALWTVDPGFRSDNVLTFGMGLPASMAYANPATIRAAIRDVDAKLAAIPGVAAVSQTWGAFPMNGDDEMLFWFDAEPKPTSQNDMKWALSYVVEPDYLNAMRIPVMRGRFFDARDDEHAPPAAVVDTVFAQKYFPNEDAVGKYIRFDDAKRAEIIGVVGHVKQWGLDRDDTETLRAEIYRPYMQMADSAMGAVPLGTGLVIRSAGPMPGLFDAARQTIQRINAANVVYGPQTMEEIISATLATRRFSMMLLGTFAALALLLASVGIYGVVSYLAGQRTREIGIRVALGAQRRHVLTLVVGDGMKMAMAGMAFGIVAALWLTRLMGNMLFCVPPTDPITFSGVALLLAAVALIACYVPARRAMRVDPMVALRYE